MQLLFTLILVYCSDFMLLQNISNEVQFEKLYTFKSKENILPFNSSTSLTDFMHKRSTNSIHGLKCGLLVPQWKIGKAGERFSCRQSLNVQTRKLLGYSDEILYQDPTKSVRSHDSKVQFREEEQRNIIKEIEKSTANHNILWDDWGNWSSCSVTCGNGRQVRWRHCSGENCSKGLKKAQIKTCRSKPCESKNILNWLGLKTR